MTETRADATTPDHLAERTERNKRYRYALTTAVIARFSGILLQVVSLPIAAFKLGPAEFSIYAMLAAILSMMTLSSLGMGQSLTLHMSRALAAGDQKTARQMLTMSLALVGGIVVTLAGLLVWLILGTSALPTVFAQHLQGAEPPVAAALFVAGVFVITQILSVLEAAQLAQQQQHRLNIMMCFGTLVAAGAVFVVASSAPSLLAILMAVHVPVILLRGANALRILADLQPLAKELRPATHHVGALFSDGIRFVTGTSLSNFLCHGLSVITVGFFLAPLATASFAALMSAVLMYFSALSLVAMPMRGAMPEAHRRDDHAWLGQARRRLFLAGAGLGGAAFVVLAFFGELLFALWYQGSVAPGRMLLVGAGAYCILMGLEVASFTYLSSTGRLAAASRWLLLRALVAAVGVFFVASQGNDQLVFWVLTLATLILSTLPLGMMMRSVGAVAP